jgi:hypothetical protein
VVWTEEVKEAARQRKAAAEAMMKEYRK